MKLNLNPDYIEYKVLFIASAYYQSISEKTAELFITPNAQPYFPEFIRYHVSKYVYKNDLNRVGIDVKGIDDIIYDIVQQYTRLNSQ